MNVFTSFFEMETRGETDIINITPQVAKILREHPIEEGLLSVFIGGSTGGITTIEYESGAISDLRKAIERIAPRDISYAHDARWGDGNGFSHVRAALMGPSLQIPIIKGDLVLGTWQQIVFCDFDNRGRHRRVTVQLIGK